MKIRTAILVTIVIVLLVSSLVRAQSGNGYDLTWFTVDSGGKNSSTGGYQLGGAIGQPDAGVLSGGDYTLAGGFWQGGGSAEPPAHYIFLPLVLR